MKSANQVVKMLYLIIQIGFTMLFTIFLCVGIGYLVQKYLHLKLMTIFIILGVVSSFKAAYILIRKFVSFENPDDEYRKLFGAEDDMDAGDMDADRMGVDGTGADDTDADDTDADDDI